MNLTRYWRRNWSGDVDARTDAPSLTLFSFSEQRSNALSLSFPKNIQSSSNESALGQKVEQRKRRQDAKIKLQKNWYCVFPTRKQIMTTRLRDSLATASHFLGSFSRTKKEKEKVVCKTACAREESGTNKRQALEQSLPVFTDNPLRRTNRCRNYAEVGGSTGNKNMYSE